MQEKEEPKFAEGFDLEHTPDVMTSLEQGGLDREKPKINYNDVGIDKAAQEHSQQLRETYKHDSESGMHKEAGMALPHKAKNDKEAVDYLNKLINIDKGDPSDKFQALLENFKN